MAEKMKGIMCCADCAGYDRKHKKCGYAPIKCEIAGHFYCDCPLPDVVEVRHGNWNRTYKSGLSVSHGYVSSCCDTWNERKSDYCPNCGARMDGDSNDT